MKKIRLFLFLFNLLADIASAQQVIFSEADRDEFRIRAKQLIEDFQMQLATIVSNTGVSDASKNIAMANALECFIGKGDAFEYTDEEGKRMMHTPVKLVMRDQYGKRMTRPLKNFLKMLKNTITQDEAIRIESIDIIMLKSVNIEDGKYNALASYLDKFSSIKDGCVVYQDVTERRIRLPIEKEVIILPNGEEQAVWPVFLGDVYIKLNKKKDD